MCRLGSCHVNMSTGQNLCRTIDENGKELIGLPSAIKAPKEVAKATAETNNAAKVKEEEGESKAVDETNGIKVKVEDGPEATNGTEDIKMKEEEGEAKATTEGTDIKVEDKEEAKAKSVEDDGIKVEDNDDEAAPKKPQPGTVLGHHSEIMNVLSKETQIKLRKNKYPFVCKRHFEQGGKKGGGRNNKNKSNNQQTQQQQPPAVVATNKPALELKERKLIDFRNKVYIAPLTTVGNLPFRRIMKHYGADITCGEMALADQLLSGKPSEWALLKRHPCEDVFGVQIAAGEIL